MCLDASNNKSYPTDLPVRGGLALWLDAADDTTFSYSSGTTVSQWRDKSGLNNHMVPISAGPTRSSVLNSRKVLAFTTAQTIGSITFTMETSANTVFVVSRLTGTTNARVLTAYYNNWLLGHWGGWVNAYYAEGWIAYNAGTADTVWRMYMGDWGGPSNDTADAFSNGTSIRSQPSADAGAGPKGLGINFQAGEPSTCEAAEIIVFNRVLSATERKQVHTYLGQKWGISNTDRSIIDLSGFNDNGLFGNGTLANMPLYDYYNKGLKFNSTNANYIKVGVNSSLQVNTVTIAAFFKTITNGQTTQFIGGYGDTGFYGYWLGMSGGPMVFSVGNSTSNLQLSSTITPNNDQIYYVVGTYDGVTQRIYVDGVLKNSATTVTGVLSYSGLTDGFLIGQVQGFSVTRYMTGNIYAMQVYSRALSAAEVAQNYETMKSKFANTIVQQGLVLNIDAANPYSYGGAGTAVYDVSNTALSWTASNITYNTDPIKYFSFNGSNSSLVSSTSSAYDSQTITMECWFYPNALAQNGFLFEKGAVNTQYSMFLNGDGTFYFRTYSSTTENNLTFTLSSYVTVSTWTHIACVYSSGTKTIYINGTQITQSTGAGAVNTGQTNQYIGKYGNAADNYPFNGRIAESRVYNIALSAAQVLQNYNATKDKYRI
jgi:hypothetical protein